MIREVIYEIKALYRDDFRVTGFRLGQGEPSVCIIGSLRGNEFQQIYVCSQLIRKLSILESKGRITEGKEILVIPCGNPYSVNTQKRFWTIDNTDIGNFVPQVRMMKTGAEDIELARQFGMPYVVLHNPRPFDTTTLNYNWQLWETDAFSIYTTSTSGIDKNSAKQAVDAVLNFLAKQGIIEYRGYEGYISRVVESQNFVDVRALHAGFFEQCSGAGEKVEKGQLLAIISDPYTAEVLQEIRAPIPGIVAFAHNETLAYQNTAVYKLIPEEDEI